MKRGESERHWQAAHVAGAADNEVKKLWRTIGTDVNIDASGRSTRTTRMPMVSTRPRGRRRSASESSPSSLSRAGDSVTGPKGGVGRSGVGRLSSDAAGLSLERRRLFSCISTSPLSMVSLDAVQGNEERNGLRRKCESLQEAENTDNNRKLFPI